MLDGKGSRYVQRALPDLLRQRDDDPFRAADVGEPVGVLVLHLTDELGVMRSGAQTCDDIIDVIDSKHDATNAQRVDRRIDRAKPDRIRRVKLIQFDFLPIGRAQRYKRGSNVVRSQADQLRNQGPFDCRLAFKREA